MRKDDREKKERARERERETVANNNNNNTLTANNKKGFLSAASSILHGRHRRTLREFQQKKHSSVIDPTRPSRVGGMTGLDF
jgi:hypothetical protein